MTEWLKWTELNICLVQVPMFIMNTKIETLLMNKAAMAKGLLSQLSTLPPAINVSHQSYWLHLPLAFPLLAISEHYRRKWEKRRKNWKNMNDEGKKWGNKELGVLFVFVFATSPQTILSYDLRKRDINISKIFSFKWDLDVISYGAKQGTTMKINLVKTITINSPV